jgi:hypothetical protein
MMMSRSDPRWRRILHRAPSGRRSEATRRERQRLSDLILKVTAVALGGGLVAMLVLSLSS